MFNLTRQLASLPLLFLSRTAKGRGSMAPAH
jgi:hypothetical protein